MKRRAGILQWLTANVDFVDVWFVLQAATGYAAFVSWAEVIVRAIRGEASQENWKTRSSSAALIAFWACTSAVRLRAAASLRGAAVEMHGLVDEAAKQAELRDQRATERDRQSAEQQARMLVFTRWMAALAALTLAAAIVTLAVTIAR